MSSHIPVLKNLTFSLESVTLFGWRSLRRVPAVLKRFLRSKKHVGGLGQVLPLHHSIGGTGRPLRRGPGPAGRLATRLQDAGPRQGQGELGEPKSRKS